MARYCRGGCRRKINQKGKYLCSRCSKSKIAGKETKADGNSVYGLYDFSGKLVYIGVTNSAKTRVSQHEGSKKFSKMKIIKRFQSRAEANAFEIFSIWHLKPPMNKKIDKPINLDRWSKTELEKFGEVATSDGKLCRVCNVKLSMYNSTDTCSVHGVQRRLTGRRRR